MTHDAIRKTGRSASCELLAPPLVQSRDERLAGAKTGSSPSQLLSADENDTVTEGGLGQ
jgi:hypothetical protein